MALPHMQIGIIGVLDSARERETAACAQSPFLKMAQTSGVRIKILNPIAFWGDGILNLPECKKVYVDGIEKGKFRLLGFTEALSRTFRERPARREGA